MTRELITSAQNTWCPGCGSFALQHTFKNLLSDRLRDGKSLDDVVLVSGIGCHAKIADYLNINSFSSLHGRAIPAATAIKLANPALTVICCVGDGDAYAEGLDHLIFAAKRNIDITVIVHNNRVYGLTTGQYTPTSPLGFKGKSTPSGTAEYPINPIDLLLASGGCFIARGYTRKMESLKVLIKAAVDHKGFSFIDVLQICATFFPAADYYDSRVYDLPTADKLSFETARAHAREWDYNSDALIALGIIYERSIPTFDDRMITLRLSKEVRERALREFCETRA